MNSTQQLEDGTRVHRVPEPPAARDAQRDGYGGAYPPRSQRTGYGAGPVGIVRLGSLVLMAVVLFAGYWEPHPLLSLALPAAAVAVWMPVIRARRVEQWLLFYVAGIYLYTVLRALADQLGFPIQFRYVIDAERLLFRGSIPSTVLQRDLFSPRDIGWLDVGATALHASFFVVPHAAAVYIWLRRPRALAAYTTSVLLTLYVGLALFILLPTVPPWLAAQQGHIFRTYRVLDFVVRGVDVDAYRTLYRTLAEPNSVASVPSIHMALTCVVLLRSRDFARRWFWPLVAYTLLMALALVYLGEHYVFDVLVGIAVAVAVEVVVVRGVRRRRALAVKA